MGFIFPSKFIISLMKTRGSTRGYWDERGVGDSRAGSMRWFEVRSRRRESQGLQGRKATFQRPKAMHSCQQCNDKQVCFCRPVSSRGGRNGTPVSWGILEPLFWGCCLRPRPSCCAGKVRTSDPGHPRPRLTNSSTHSEQGSMIP